MLNQNGEEDNISSSPVVWVYLTHVLDQNRLFSRLKVVKILDNARIRCWEASENQNWYVHGDSKVRNEAHDRLPVSNAISALSMISLAILGYVLDLDCDFQQVGEEWEQRCEGERHCKESNESKLH